MALVEYIEPTNIGSFFTGIGSLIFAAVLAYIFYRLYVKFCQYLDVVINRESKYEILEESFLDGIAKKKGIDLEKELVKRQMFDEKKKSFRARLEEQIYEEMFGKEDKEKGK